MENLYLKGKDHGTFSWVDLGNVKKGRDNLGDEMPVMVYRLMEYTLLHVLNKDMGREKADYYLREAGHLAGKEFARNLLVLDADFDSFMANLQKALQNLKIGILHIEAVSQNAEEIILTIAEDLNCSGLPISYETVCVYDEGFLAGVLGLYTGKPYTVREIDCWANGTAVCRFKCTVKK